MKKSCVGFVACILLIFSGFANAQVVKIENGVAISSSKIGDGSLKTTPSYQMSIGIDYLDNSWFNLSSNIGYISKGSDDKVFLYHDGSESLPYDYLNYNADYLTLNTTFQVKKDIRNETYYIGVGPRVDFKIKDHLSDEAKEFSDISFNSVLYGLKCEIGFNYLINNTIQLGFNASYLPTFNKQFEEIRERTFSLGISVGYVLN